MDYFIRGRFEIEDEEQLAALLQAEIEMQKVTFKSGTIYRADYGSERFDVFTIEARTYTEPEALSLYNEIKSLYDDNGIQGWVGWHECTHNIDREPCSWDEFYSSEVA